MSITVHLRMPKKLRRRAKPARVLASFEAWRDAGSPCPVVPDEACNADVSIRLPDGDLAEIDAAALGCGMGRSEFLRALLAAEYSGARPRRAQKRSLALLAPKPLPKPSSSSPTVALARVSRLPIERPILDAVLVDETPARREPLYSIQRPGRGLEQRQVFKALCESFTRESVLLTENDELRARLEQRGNGRQEQRIAQQRQYVLNDGSPHSILMAHVRGQQQQQQQQQQPQKQKKRSLIDALFGHRQEQ